MTYQEEEEVGKEESGEKKKGEEEKEEEAVGDVVTEQTFAAVVKDEALEVEAPQIVALVIEQG